MDMDLPDLTSWMDTYSRPPSGLVTVPFGSDPMDKKPLTGFDPMDDPMDRI
jgi:hypothetical protein